MPSAPHQPDVLEVMKRVRAEIEKVIEGKPAEITMALTVLLAEGHLLVEDVPGVGKTMLAKALGRSLDLNVHRIQFTPDLLPADITGVSVFNQATREFEFKPGGIFAPIVVGDEINRASPKTQAAMLEAMEERQVSADGTTHRLERPFMVIATQNPIEMEGTYPLPEAQRDRFMARIAMGYPARSAELAMMDSHGQREPLESVTPVADAATIDAMVGTVRDVYVSPAVKEYLVGIIDATRRSPQLRLGASPRATLHLLRASRASAILDGRDFVIPDDVRTLAPALLRHRLLLSPEAQVARANVDDVLQTCIAAVAIPGDRRRP